MAQATWHVLQRQTDALRVAGTPVTFCTIVRDAGRGTALGTGIAADSMSSLERAFTHAVKPVTAGARRPLPGRVLCAAALVSGVTRIGRRLGFEVAAREPTDLDENILDSLISHLAGRAMPSDPPAPADWELFYLTANVFTEREVWTRWADTARFHLALKMGAQRQEATAIVMGNAEIQHGVVVFPSRRIAPDLFDGDVRQLARRIPDGTGQFLLERDRAPTDLRERALRYRWPPHSPWTPVLLVIRGGRPSEPGGRDLRAMTLTLQAIIERDRLRPSVAPTPDYTSGELRLGDGRLGRYRVEVVAEETIGSLESADVPGTIHMFAGELQTDLIPEGTRVRLGAIPWAEADRARGSARVFAPGPRKMPRVGPGLPVALIQLDQSDADSVRLRLEEHPPDGLLVVSQRKRPLLTLLCRDAAYLLLAAPSGSSQLDAFQAQLDANDGGHAIVVSLPGDDPLADVIAVYECVLRRPPKASG